MAWLNTIEGWSEVNGELTQEPGPNQWSLFASRIYTVLYSHAATIPEVLTATGLDALGDSWSAGYTFLKCQKRRTVPLGPRLWQVVCEFGGTNSPLLQAYDRRWTWVPSTEALEIDANGAVIRNPVGDRYEGLTTEVADPVYSVTRNQATFDQATLSAYWRSVNSDIFLTWPVGQAHITDIAGQQVYEGGSYYWRATYQIQFRRDGWARRTLCEGPRYFDADGIRQKFDDTTKRKGRLSAAGLKLDDADPDVIQEFDEFLPVAYVPLGLS